MQKLKPTKPSVVIDTNLFISAFIWGGTPYKLLKLWQVQKIEIVSSQELLLELTDVLNRNLFSTKYHITPEAIKTFAQGIEFSATIIEPYPVSDLPIHSRDIKDDMILTVALSGNADYLITGDEDLLVLDGKKELGTLKILKAEEFLHRDFSLFDF